MTTVSWKTNLVSTRVILLSDDGHRFDEVGIIRCLIFQHVDFVLLSLRSSGHLERFASKRFVNRYGAELLQAQLWSVYHRRSPRLLIYHSRLTFHIPEKVASTDNVKAQVRREILS
jgi:hypothetical protein